MNWVLHFIVFMLIIEYFCYLPCFHGTGSGTTLRLKQMGMEFTVWVFKHVKSFFSMLQLAITFALCSSREYDIHIHFFCEEITQYLFLNSMLHVIIENAMKDHTNLRQCPLLFFILGFQVFLSEFAKLVSLDLFIKLQGKIDQLKLMGPVILNAILKMLDGFTGSEAGQLYRKNSYFPYIVQKWI